MSKKVETKSKNRFYMVWGGVLTMLVIIGVLVGMIVKDSTEKRLPTFLDSKEKITVSKGDFKYEKQAYIGDPNAPVKLIEFFDYKCPACKNWTDANFSNLKRDYLDTGKAVLYLVNFPFLGADSITAAMMGEIMWKQSPEAFMQYHEAMWANQKSEADQWAVPSYLLKLVKKDVPAANYDKAKADIKAWKGLFETKEDFKVTTVNGVSGTPTFFVDGVQVDRDYAVLTKAIDNKQGK